MAHIPFLLHFLALFTLFITSPVTGKVITNSPKHVSRATTTSTCFSNTMCISGSLNGSNVQYELSAMGSNTPGWMGIGFGSQMAGSPMVIFWSNTDGTITMSQRQASGQTMPTVVSSPARVASFVPGLSSASGSVRYTFTVPSDGNTTPDIIYAYSATNPGSSSADATIRIHTVEGSTQLDLVSGTTASTTGRTRHEKLFLAHGVVSVLGTLVFFPLGALIARYLRTFTVAWFPSHWAVQLSGEELFTEDLTRSVLTKDAMAKGTVFLIVGFALGIQGVTEMGGSHFSGTHQRIGITVFVLAILQCVLGWFIHKFKIGKPFQRPPQNYVHAILGLLILALSFYQFYSGYNEEWPEVSGENRPNGIHVLFIVWAVVSP
ncbi:hypothetical protein L218DRAFT_708508 [Marasmius fiardii PR-910]|nr:hypothetical protein L218DRAFT_708508 [Marasmius fiardii PR-910]